VFASRSPFWKALPSILIIGLSTNLACAEDWTTTDGTVYQDVRVIKIEADAVTILYRDGGLLLPLNKLPPDLQKRLNYDAQMAKAAAKQRADLEKSSAKALQAEIEETDALKQKDAVAQAKALAQAHAQTSGLPPPKK
jgi:hypothetical protein